MLPVIFLEVFQRHQLLFFSTFHSLMVTNLIPSTTLRLFMHFQEREKWNVRPSFLCLARGILPLGDRPPRGPSVFRVCEAFHIISAQAHFPFEVIAWAGMLLEQSGRVWPP